MADIEQTNLTSLTVDLLSAYFANNTVESTELSGLIRSTHEALKGIDSPEPETPAEQEFKGAVTARKSLGSKDQIISMIDGKAYKTLTRHLKTHGLTPAEYRQRYKLPHDYPMVAPGYSEARRAVAAKLGLGRKPRAAAPAPAEPVSPAEPATPATPAKAKSSTKAPAKSAAPKPARAKKATAPTASLSAPTPEAAVSPPGTDTARSPATESKKPGRKPKAAAPAKPAAKRAPRKAKVATEPAASGE